MDALRFGTRVLDRFLQELLMDLTGKAALVTGGASGIGAAAVRRLARRGAVVAVVDRDEAAARALADEVGGLALPGDVSDRRHRWRWWSTSPRTASAGSTSCCSTPGSPRASPAIEDLDLAGYRRIMGVNVDHVVFGLSAAVPALRRAGGGTIIATASLAGLVPMPGDPLYTLTKHAVVGYVRAAAPRWRAEGIRVNAVCPGFADTPLIAAARDQFGEFPLLTADDVVDAVEAILDRGEPGECWFVPARPRARARTGSAACPARPVARLRPPVPGPDH